MKDVLIINLKRFGDIYQSAHLTNSIIKNDAMTRVSYLVFDEFKQAAECLNNIHKIFTIPRKQIITFYKNPIYSAGFGINELEKTLRPLIEIPWSNVINFSNDKVSTYLTSYITKSIHTSFTGIRFTEKQTIEYSDPWANVYNDIVTSYLPSPINIVDVVHLQSKLHYITEGEKIKTNPEHNETVFNNFKKLRESNRNREGYSNKIVGIQIKASVKSKDIPSKIIVQLLKIYLDTPSLIPVLLLAPTDQERELANKINKSLDKKIINIEADLIALPSVIQNLDIIITPDTSVKHLSDILNTPCLEISLGPSSLFQQGTCNPHSKILSYRVDQRNFSYNTNLNKFVDQESLDPKDIFKCSQVILGNLNIDSTFDQKTQWTLYTPIKDSLGTFLANKSGFINLDIEMRRLLARQLLSKIFKGSLSLEIFKYIIFTFDESKLQKWIENEKVYIASTTKDLLSTLRSLIQTQENMKKGQSFVISLGKLLDHCQKKSLSAIPILLFRGRLESLTPQSIEDNFKEVENLLYKLKDNMQSAIFCLKELESAIMEKKRETITGKIRYSNHEANP